MSLLNDGPPSGMVDLMAQDSQVMDVAVQENIDVSGKLALAQEEVRLEVKSMLDSLTSTTGLIGTYQGLWAGVPPGVGNVAVTPALKLWHTYRTLFLIYSDAYYSQLNDRYGAKRDQFDQRANWAWEKVMQHGLGIVQNPVPSGNLPGLTAIPGGTFANGTYYAAVTWVNSAGEEGSCGPVASITTVGSVIAATAGAAPAAATGWNFYLGIAPDGLALQNGSPLQPGQVWHQPGTIQQGRKPGDGQHANYTQPVPRIMQRG